MTLRVYTRNGSPSASAAAPRGCRSLSRWSGAATAARRFQMVSCARSGLSDRTSRCWARCQSPGHRHSRCSQLCSASAAARTHDAGRKTPYSVQRQPGGPVGSAPHRHNDCRPEAHDAGCPAPACTPCGMQQHCSETLSNVYRLYTAHRFSRRMYPGRMHVGQPALSNNCGFAQETAVCLHTHTHPCSRSSRMVCCHFTQTAAGSAWLAASGVPPSASHTAEAAAAAGDQFPAPSLNAHRVL